MPNTGAFSADIRGFKILKIAVIAGGGAITAIFSNSFAGGGPGAPPGKFGTSPPPPCPRYIPFHFFLVYVHVRVLVKIKQMLIETAISTLKRPN